MPSYHGPRPAETARRMVAAKLAYDDLSPEARIEVDAFMFRIRQIHDLGPSAALEIVAAIAMLGDGNLKDAAAQPKRLDTIPT